jgi:hypothetical protein
MEKRVLFYGSPVKPLCTTILAIISLHPHLLNKGLCDDFEPRITPTDNKNETELPIENDVDENDANKPMPIVLKSN